MIDVIGNWINDFSLGWIQYVTLSALLFAIVLLPFGFFNAFVSAIAGGGCLGIVFVVGLTIGGLAVCNTGMDVIYHSENFYNPKSLLAYGMFPLFVASVPLMLAGIFIYVIPYLADYYETALFSCYIWVPLLYVPINAVVAYTIEPNNFFSVFVLLMFANIFVAYSALGVMSKMKEDG